jgi:RND family efflux transporter MFP subunit
MTAKHPPLALFLENCMLPDPTHASVRVPRAFRLAAFALLALALVIVAMGIISRRSSAASLQEQADRQSVRTVAVITPGSASGNGAAATLELPGRLEAQARAPLYARVSGYIKSWTADIGTKVKAGQLLAEIEAPDLDQQLLQARADLASAQANLSLAGATAKRWQSLVASDSVSRQEADEKSNDLAIKQASVNAAQANVDRLLATKNFTRIVAPFDGTVTARSTDVGALINAGSGGTGQELFVVSDTRRLRVYINLPQNYVSLVKRGATARLSVPENPGKTYTATLESTSGAVTAGSGSMLVQLSVDNAQSELLPGGYANVSINLPGDVKLLNVPPSALIFDKSGLHVATVDSMNRVVLKTVTIARDYGRVIALASGLSATDRVIESPPDGVGEGDQVRIAEPAAKVAPASGKQ